MSPRIAVPIAFLAFFGSSRVAQSQSPQLPGQPAAQAQTSLPLSDPSQPPFVATGPSKYRDVDLLRQLTFRNASEATVSVRITMKPGEASDLKPDVLNPSAYSLIVNGTQRAVRSGRFRAADSELPLALLIFPPNQPVVHSIAVQQSARYFQAQPTGTSGDLPWKVGLFDANGQFTPFTTKKADLLSELHTLEHTLEPLQYASSDSLPVGLRNAF